MPTDEATDAIFKNNATFFFHKRDNGMQQVVNTFYIYIKQPGKIYLHWCPSALPICATPALLTSISIALFFSAIACDNILYLLLITYITFYSISQCPLCLYFIRNISCPCLHQNPGYELLLPALQIVRQWPCRSRFRHLLLLLFFHFKLNIKFILFFRLNENILSINTHFSPGLLRE